MTYRVVTPRQLHVLPCNPCYNDGMMWQKWSTAIMWRWGMLAVMLAALDSAACFSQSLESVPCEDARAVICMQSRPAANVETSCAALLGFTLEMYPAAYFRPPHQASDHM